MQPTTVNRRQENTFSRVAKSDAVTYSTFDRSHTHTTAFNEGLLIPILVDEVLPADIKRCDFSSLTRLLTPIVPFMDNVYLDFQAWYVPFRLIFNKWKELQGEQRNPNDSVDYMVPMLNSGATGVAVESVFDYAGVPPLVPYLEFSSAPFRAMNLIWNEWYRDQNLQQWRNVGGTGTSANPVDEFGETDQLSNYTLLPRGKRHDYFTSALPWQQKGDPVLMPITGNAPVVLSGDSQLVLSVNGVAQGNRTALTVSNGESTPRLIQAKYPDISVPNNDSLWYSDGITGYADMSNVSAISIADFITAMQINAIKTLDARTGTRYYERLQSQWRITPANAELQRPEYLGGSSVAFYTNPVANTTGTATDPQGNLAAFSFAHNKGKGFTKAFQEHGWIIGFLSVRTNPSYQQGLHKMFSRKSRFDFYEPLLANISEQAIKNKEIYAQGSSVLNGQGTPVDEDTFGYQEAWAEYRYFPNMITGKMRSQVQASLDTWHLAQEFAELPKLNSDFIEEKPPISRVVAIQNQPHFFSNNYFRMLDTREMPIYSIPAYLGSRL